MKSRSKSTNKPDTELAANETLNGLNYSSYERSCDPSSRRLSYESNKNGLKKMMLKNPNMFLKKMFSNVITHMNKIYEINCITLGSLLGLLITRLSYKTTKY